MSVFNKGSASLVTTTVAARENDVVLHNLEAKITEGVLATIKRNEDISAIINQSSSSYMAMVSKRQDMPNLANMPMDPPAPLDPEQHPLSTRHAESRGDVGSSVYAAHVGSVKYQIAKPL